MKFLYENHEDFSPIPSFFVQPALVHIMSGGSFDDVVPGKSVNLASILHGEQYVEFLGDLPVEGVLTNRSKVAEVLDKGSGAAVVHNGKIFLNPFI